MMHTQSMSYRKERGVFRCTRLAGSVRDRVIVTNLATSSSSIDKSIACRHAVMTFNPVLANQKPGYKPSWIT
jgi:hypothetical protein